jgi:hypothetical protein
MNGAKVVVLLLGSIAVIVGLVLIGFTVFEPEAAPCADGDLARNPLVDGRYQARTEKFATVEEAEAFICHDVPELHAEGRMLERIEAMRTVPIEFLVEGDGIGVVTLEYESEAGGSTLTLDAAPFFGLSYFRSLIAEQHTEEDVQVQGQDATAYRYGINPDQVEVVWVDETLEHRAIAQLDANFTLQDMLELLETLE